MICSNLLHSWNICVPVSASFKAQTTFHITQHLKTLVVKMEPHAIDLYYNYERLTTREISQL